LRKSRRAGWRQIQLALLLFSSLVAVRAQAQGATAVLLGNVVDASTKAPVADVVVTATSPALQGEQVVVTDATGLYRIPQLPPGVYTLRFEKESYRPFSRSAIDVAADRTLRLNVELLPETAGTETVTVVGTPPTIDIASSTVGTTISQDFIRNIAVSRAGGLGGSNRSFDSLAVTAPQAAADIYGVSINGTTSPENSYRVDGLSVNDPAYGVLGTPITIEFLDEVNVITGGYMPEYGRSTGGTISAITKSGGNEFHGSVFGTFTPGALQGNPHEVAAAGSVVSGERKLYNIGDFGATLGGYILKDKLWFFAGFQPSFQRYSYTRRFSKEHQFLGFDSNGAPTFATDNAGNVIYDAIPNTDQRRFADEKSYNFIGKLTYLINSDHRVSVSVIGTPTTGGGDASFSIRQPGALQLRNPFNATVYTTNTFNAFHYHTETSAYDVNGQLNSSFLDKRLLLDVRVGWHHQKNVGEPGDGSGFDVLNPTNGLAGTSGIAPLFQDNLLNFENQVPAAVRTACTDPATGQPGLDRCQVSNWLLYGGPNFLEKLNLDSYQFNGVATYLLTAAGHHVFKAGFDGNLKYYEHTKTYGGGTTYNNFGGFVRESRRFGYIASPDTPGAPGALGPVLNEKTRSTLLGGFVQDSWSILDKVTVNVGVRWDGQYLYDKDGILGIKLTDGWSPRIGIVWDPTQQGRAKLFANYGRYYEDIPLDISDRALSGESQIAANHACDPQVDKLSGCDAKSFVRGGNRFSPSRIWRVIAADKTAVDPDLKSPANDEIVAGAEYEVIPNARAGVSYTYRNQFRTVEDMSADDGNTYFVGNPGRGIGSSFPEATRKYHAVTVSFTKSFSDLWLAQLSYTWQQLRGNYEGLFRNEDNQLDPNINSTFDLAKLLVNQTGPLTADNTHVFKLYGAKEFVVLPVFSVTLGLSYTGISGSPINYTGPSNESGYGPSQVYILERGQGGRLPWIHSIDARLQLNYRLSKDSVISVGVEAFNLFNFQAPATVDNEYINFPSVNGGRDPGPIIGGKNGSLPNGYGGRCDASGDLATCTGGGSLPRGANLFVKLPTPDQTPDVYQINPNWGRPLTYQPVRSFRFSARFTF
jgi:hypothetical protein